MKKMVKQKLLSAALITVGLIGAVVPNGNACTLAFSVLGFVCLIQKNIFID